MIFGIKEKNNKYWPIALLLLLQIYPCYSVKTGLWSRPHIHTLTLSRGIQLFDSASILLLYSVIFFWKLSAVMCSSQWRVESLERRDLSLLLKLSDWRFSSFSRLNTLVWRRPLCVLRAWRQLWSSDFSLRVSTSPHPPLQTSTALRSHPSRMCEATSFKLSTASHPSFPHLTGENSQVSACSGRCWSFITRLQPRSRWSHLISSLRMMFFRGRTWFSSLVEIFWHWTGQLLTLESHWSAQAAQKTCPHGVLRGSSKTFPHSLQIRSGSTGPSKRSRSKPIILTWSSGTTRQRGERCQPTLTKRSIKLVVSLRTRGASYRKHSTSRAVWWARD